MAKKDYSCKRSSKTKPNEYKHGRKTNLEFIKVIAFKAVYQCPFCKVEHQESLDINVARVKCSECGNEIIFS